MKKSNVMPKIECMIFVLLVFCFAQVFAADCGDVDSDGTVDIVDALLIAQYYVNLNPANFDATVADVDGSGDIDIVDALLVAQFYVGLIDELPGCEPEVTPVPPDEVTYELQAEDEEWSSGGVETEHSGYTGTGYVNTDNSSGEWIEWSFDLSAASTADCVFTYACESDDRPMDLSINGSVVANLGFPASGAWTTYATQAADTVNLGAGGNTIRLTATASNGTPNMDKMDITITGGQIVAPTTPPTPTPGPTADPNDTPGPTANPGVMIGWATEGGGTTGGGDASPVTATSLSELNDLAGGSTSRVIYVDGQFSGTLTIGSNKTIIGRPGARISNSGAVVKFGSSSNIIVRNMHFQSSADGSADMANISGGHHIWIDHCNLVNGGDGLLDIRDAADYITISWCKIWYTAQTGHQNAMLIGHSDSADGDSGHLRVTFHHNWWAENVDERQPRVRFGRVHIFNSLYVATQGFTSYAIRPGYKANIRSERNIFYDFSGQSEAADDAKHEYGECLVFNYAFNKGDSILETIEDVFINCTERGIDADDVEGGTFGNGTAFTPPYSYTLDSTSGLEEAIRNGAGPTL